MVQTVDQRAVNTVRCLAADVVKGANSGHPGKDKKKKSRTCADMNVRCSYGLCPHGSHFIP